MYRLILFPGAHKTGTTLLQAALETNRQILEVNGFALVGRKPFYQSELCRYLKTWSHKLGDEVSLESARASVKKLCGGDLAKNIIISIENIFGEFGHKPRIYPAVRPVLREMSRILPDHEIRVVYYTRRQDRYFESIFVQRVHKLNAQPFSDFYQEWKRHDMRWTPILEDIAAEIGRNNLVVAAFETIKTGLNNFVSDMFRHIQPGLEKIASSLDPEARDTNISLSGKGINLALLLFPELDRGERKIFVEFLKCHFSKRDYPPAVLLSDEQRFDLLKNVKTDNELLVRKYFQEDSSVREFYSPELPSNR